MKAIICNAYGPIENLAFGEMPDPQPAAREVLVKAEAIGVNFPDGLLVQGLYQAKPPTPFIPGMELVGTVLAVGEDVIDYKIGDRVAGLAMMGAFAEKAVVPAANLMLISAQADAAEMTALMCGFGTSHHALKQRANLKAGETLLVTGAAGLTGLAAIQIGKTMGAKVIAVASSQAKRDICLANGADEALGYEDLKENLKKATNGNGVDVVFDVVGGEVFDICSRSMAWGGRLLVVGFASGTIPQFPVNLALVKGYAIVGVFWGSFTAREPKIYQENMQELMGWYLTGKIKPHVEAVYPLAEAAKALQFIHDRKAIGKVVLKP